MTLKFYGLVDFKALFLVALSFCPSKNYKIIKKKLLGGQFTLVTSQKVTYLCIESVTKFSYNFFEYSIAGKQFWNVFLTKHEKKKEIRRNEYRKKIKTD